MTTATRPADEVLTIEQLAAWLQIPVQTIYKLRHQRKGPPGIKVGRRLRFRTADVDKWWTAQLAAAA